ASVSTSNSLCATPIVTGEVPHGIEEEATQAAVSISGRTVDAYFAAKLTSNPPVQAESASKLGQARSPSSLKELSTISTAAPDESPSTALPFPLLLRSSQDTLSALAELPFAPTRTRPPCFFLSPAKQPAINTSHYDDPSPRFTQATREPSHELNFVPDPRSVLPTSNFLGQSSTSPESSTKNVSDKSKDDGGLTTSPIATTNGTEIDVIAVGQVQEGPENRDGKDKGKEPARFGSTKGKEVEGRSPVPSTTSTSQTGSPEASGSGTSRLKTSVESTSDAGAQEQKDDRSESTDVLVGSDEHARSGVSSTITDISSSRSSDGTQYSSANPSSKTSRAHFDESDTSITASDALLATSHPQSSPPRGGPLGGDQNSAPLGAKANPFSFLAFGSPFSAIASGSWQTQTAHFRGTDATSANAGGGDTPFLFGKPSNAAFFTRATAVRGWFDAVTDPSTSTWTPPSNIGVLISTSSFLGVPAGGRATPSSSTQHPPITVTAPRFTPLSGSSAGGILPSSPLSRSSVAGSRAGPCQPVSSSSPQSESFADFLRQMAADGAKLMAESRFRAGSMGPSSFSLSLPSSPSSSTPSPSLPSSSSSIPSSPSTPERKLFPPKCLLPSHDSGQLDNECFCGEALFDGGSFEKYDIDHPVEAWEEALSLNWCRKCWKSMHRKCWSDCELIHSPFVPP
ncbi:hypothetical protein V5O48_017867, partial [Marasmius crinis-equi]